MVNLIRHRRKWMLRKYTSLNRLKLMRINKLRQIENQKIQQQFNVPTYDIPISDIPTMKAGERKQLRKKYPNLPMYMFMNKHEKKLYFKRKTKQYQRKLKKSPTKKPTHKKAVQFFEEYDVMVFAKEEEAECIGRTQTFKDTYSFEHFHY